MFSIGLLASLVCVVLLIAAISYIFHLDKNIDMCQKHHEPWLGFTRDGHRYCTYYASETRAANDGKGCSH